MQKTEGFTLKLALVDAIPVVLFSITVGLLTRWISSPIFAAGSALIIMAGLLKVVWKILMATGRNIPILSKQFRFLCPTGFLLQLIALFTNPSYAIAVLRHALELPSLLCFLIGIACMGGMLYMATHHDQMNVAANWAEQGINCIMQLMFLVGVILL